MRGLGLLGVWEGWEGDGGEHWVVRTGPRHSFSPLRDHQYLKSKTRELQCFSAETQNHSGSMFDCKIESWGFCAKRRKLFWILFIFFFKAVTFISPSRSLHQFLFLKLILQKQPKTKLSNVNAKHQMHLIVNKYFKFDELHLVSYFLYFCIIVRYYCQMLMTGCFWFNDTSVHQQTLFPPFKKAAPYCLLTLNTENDHSRPFLGLFDHRTVLVKSWFLFMFKHDVTCGEKCFFTTWKWLVQILCIIF